MVRNDQKIKNNLKPLRIKRVILYAESFLFAGETMRIESQYEGIDANYSNEYIIEDRDEKGRYIPLELPENMLDRCLIF